MNKKKTYIASRVEIVNMCSADNIAQFIVTSRRIGEDAGEAKRYYFFDEEIEEPTNNETYWANKNNSWEDK